MRAVASPAPVETPEPTAKPKPASRKAKSKKTAEVESDADAWPQEKSNAGSGGIARAEEQGEIGGKEIWRRGRRADSKVEAQLTRLSRTNLRPRPRSPASKRVRPRRSHPRRSPKRNREPKKTSKAEKEATPKPKRKKKAGSKKTPVPAKKPGVKKRPTPKPDESPSGRKPSATGAHGEAAQTRSRIDPDTSSGAYRATASGFDPSFASGSAAVGHHDRKVRPRKRAGSRTAALTAAAARVLAVVAPAGQLPLPDQRDHRRDSESPGAARALEIRHRAQQRDAAGERARV